MIDYLADWFGWFIDVRHDANRVLFRSGNVGTVAVRTTPLFPPPLFVGFSRLKIKVAHYRISVRRVLRLPREIYCRNQALTNYRLMDFRVVHTRVRIVRTLSRLVIARNARLALVLTARTCLGRRGPRFKSARPDQSSNNYSNTRRTRLRIYSNVHQER